MQSSMSHAEWDGSAICSWKRRCATKSVVAWPLQLLLQLLLLQLLLRLLTQLLLRIWRLPTTAYRIRKRARLSPCMKITLRFSHSPVFFCRNSPFVVSFSTVSERKVNKAPSPKKKRYRYIQRDSLAFRLRPGKPGSRRRQRFDNSKKNPYKIPIWVSPDQLELIAYCLI